MSKIELTDSELIEMMRRAGLRPSLQRLAVLSYVAGRRTHPTPDEIFTEMAPKFPSLSRTTVYNALHALTDAGLLRELDIEAGCQRYDLAPQTPHGHFVCRMCGRIFDMPLPLNIDLGAMEGFRTEAVDFRARGVCPACDAGSHDTDNKTITKP